MPDIRKATDIEGSEMTRFYEEAFSGRGRFLGEHWRWLYRVNRVPGFEPRVLVDGERVVGHAGAIPFSLSLRGKTAPAVWFVDFLLLPEYQGKGHGKALTEAWMTMCPNRATFCNDRSIQVFRRFGWKERSDASVLTQPLELSRPLGRYGSLGASAGALLTPAWLSYQRRRLAAAPRAEIVPLPQDAGALGAAFDEPANDGTRVVRDADWFKWRLLENPRRAEHFLARCGHVSAVFRLFTSLGRLRAHLLFVGPGPALARADMLAVFARWALEQRADVAWAVAVEPALLEDARAHFSRRRAARFAWHSDDPEVAEALAGPLPTQGIDSDHDLMFP